MDFDNHEFNHHDISGDVDDGMFNQTPLPIPGWPGAYASARQLELALNFSQSDEMIDTHTPDNVNNHESSNTIKNKCIEKINLAIQEGSKNEVLKRLTAAMDNLGLGRAINSIKNTIDDRHQITDITDTYIEYTYSQQYVQENVATNPQLSVTSPFRIMRNTKNDLDDGYSGGLNKDRFNRQAS